MVLNNSLSRSLVLELKNMFDERLVPLYEKCNGDIALMNELTIPFRDRAWSPLAERLIDFLFNYNEGMFFPDRWGFDDPPRDRVDKETRERIIHIISRPCMQLSIKHLSKPKTDIFIYNDYPNRAPTKALFHWGPSRGEIHICLDRRQSFDLAVWSSILKDFCQAMDTDYGYIYEEDESIHFPLKRPLTTVFSYPYHNLINRREEEIVSSRKMYDFVNGFLNSNLLIAGESTTQFYTYRGIPVAPFEIGINALNMLQDMLESQKRGLIQTGLMFALNYTIDDFQSINWEEPNHFLYSSIYLSRIEMATSFNKYFHVAPFPTNNDSLLCGFTAYSLKAKDSREKHILLVRP